MRTRKIWDMTWPEIKDAMDNGAGVILPVGAAEQHGMHMPTSTDTVMATEAAFALAEENNLLVALPILYTCKSRPQSGGGMDFVGTHGLDGQTFIDMVRQIINGFVQQGYKRIVVLNGHMENSNFLYEAAYQAAERGLPEGTKIVVFEMAFDKFSDELMKKMFGDNFPGWGYDHAAIYETSVLLYIRPDLVQFDKAMDDKPEEMVWYDVLPVPKSHTTKSGTLWKSKHATAELGKMAWEEQISKLNEAIKKELP